jgi:hypothetical protein
VTFAGDSAAVPVVYLHSKKIAFSQPSLCANAPRGRYRIDNVVDIKTEQLTPEIADKIVNALIAKCPREHGLPSDPAGDRRDSAAVGND